MKTAPFFQTIYNLRLEGQIILYGQKHDLSEKADADLALFLESEYEKESVDFPFEVPKFDAKAAIWAATTVYRTAYLTVHREKDAAEMPKLLNGFKDKITASAILSADLCLRFVPQLLEQLRKFDEKDAVIPILTKHLTDFHYSAIGYDILNVSEIDFASILGNDCLKQLYLDRVWERRDVKLASQPQIRQPLQANFGDYAREFWPNLILDTTS